MFIELGYLHIPVPGPRKEAGHDILDYCGGTDGVSRVVVLSGPEDG